VLAQDESPGIFSLSNYSLRIIPLSDRVLFNLFPHRSSISRSDNNSSTDSNNTEPLETIVLETGPKDNLHYRRAVLTLVLCILIVFSRLSPQTDDIGVDPVSLDHIVCDEIFRKLCFRLSKFSYMIIPSGRSGEDLEGQHQQHGKLISDLIICLDEAKTLDLIRSDRINMLLLASLSLLSSLLCNG
jgi:hypothetical protein